MALNCPDCEHLPAGAECPMHAAFGRMLAKARKRDQARREARERRRLADDAVLAEFRKGRDRSLPPGDRD